MGSLLAALTTIIVTALAALFALPYVIDWNDYKSSFEAQAAKLVGRPVRLDGTIDLSILPMPTLNLRGLRVADEYGKFERPFVDVEGLNVVLSLPALLSGTIEAKSLELDQPILRLKVDEFGEGTWQSIGPHGLDIPIPITNVVLDKVEISDGAIELRRGHEPSATRIDRISGTFSADSLSGPFRFAGWGGIGGTEREIRISAGSLRDSALRIKASFRSADGVSLYQLDGDIKGLEGPLHYIGPVAARLALDSTAKSAATGQLAEPMAGKAVELRATSRISLEDAKLDDITLTVTQNDRPQSFTGSAFASWGMTPRLDLEVESSWFDIDQMLRGEGTGERPVPSAAIAALPRIFDGWSFTPRQGQIKAKIQQAGLGADVVEALNFTASHDNDGWQIDTLTARLPGEAEIDVKGTLSAGDALGFNGDVTLSGKNLSRLLRWAAPTLGVVDAGNAQNFSLSSAVTLTPVRLAFNEAKGALGDSSFTVDLIHDYGAESKLLLSLQSERLDLRRLYASEDEEDLAVAASGLPIAAEPLQGGEPITDAAPVAKTSLADVLQTVFKADQSNVSLLITQLQLPDFEARDVRSAFRYEEGTFDIQELNLATTDGLRVRADGRVTGFDSKPDGAVNLTIDAPSAQSVTNLARLAGVDSVSSGARQRMEALAPFRLSGNLSGVRNERLLTLTVAGNAGGSELTFNGRLIGDLESLHNAKVDLNGMIANADGHRLIAQLAPEVSIGDAATAQAGGGILKVSALGTVKSGLVSRIELQTPQARGRFEGEIAPLDEPSWSFRGALDMRASQAGTALSMLRLLPGGSPITGAMDLRAEIVKEATKYSVAGLALNIAGETIRGTAEVDMASGRPAANIDIQAASATLPKIAAYLVDWDHEDLNAQLAEVSTGGSAFWANRAFSLAAIQGSDGTLKLKAGTMALSDDITLSDAALEVSLASGTLSVSRLDGRLYGGKFSASGTLKALQGRAALDARLKLANADLGALSRNAAGRDLARGKVDLDLAMEGQGLSPRGLLTVLAGSGELRLTRGSIEGLSPAVLKKAADVYMSEEIPDKAGLVTFLDGDFRKGSLPFNPITAPVLLKDGVLRVAEAGLDGDDYQAQAGLTLDLASLRLDSEWEVAYTGQTSDGQRLPPVRLVFAGPVAGLGQQKGQLHADEFERFLTIRRMDAEMEKLERLNEQRGPAIERGETRRRPDVPSPGQHEEPGAQPSGTIPTQSVLRGAPPRIPGASPPALAPVVPGNEPPPAGDAPVSGWSTGVETTGDAPDAAPPPADAGQARQPPEAGAQNSADFEAQIRQILGSPQGRGGAPRPDAEDQQFRSQSYSRGGLPVED